MAWRIFQKETVPSHTSLSYLQSSPTETNISNPCYPRGYSTSFDLGHVFGSLCTEKQRPDNYNPDDIVTFTGTGDPWLCREKVASVFDFKACQEQDACSFDGIYQPKVQGPFVVRPRARWRGGGSAPPGECPSPIPFLSLSCCLYSPLPMYLANSLPLSRSQAFAGFYYTASALNLSGSFSLMLFNSSSWDFCRHTWIEVSIQKKRVSECPDRQ